MFKHVDLILNYIDIEIGQQLPLIFLKLNVWEYLIATIRKKFTFIVTRFCKIASYTHIPICMAH